MPDQRLPGRAQGRVAPRSRLIIGALALVVGLLLFHGRPLLVFHFTVRPEIEAGDMRHTLEMQTEYLDADSTAGWSEIVAGDTSLNAPLIDGQQESRGQCVENCILQLERGQVAFLSGPAPGTFEAAKLEFAPSARDLSFWRSRSANWATVEALAARGLARSRPHETFRYESVGSQGIVTRVESVGIERFVVYSYSPNGDAGRTIGFSRTGPELVRRMLGGLRVANAIHEAP
jgi:hypothetical protein